MVYLTTDLHPSRNFAGSKPGAAVLEAHIQKLKKCNRFLRKDKRVTCGLPLRIILLRQSNDVIWNKVKESMMTHLIENCSRHNPSTCRSKNVIFISIRTVDYAVWTPSCRSLSLILLCYHKMCKDGPHSFGLWRIWSVAVRFRNCCAHHGICVLVLAKAAASANKRESK